MNISSEDYAFLSEMAYETWEAGESVVRESPSGDEYEVLEVLADPYGYYGVIFLKEPLNNSPTSATIPHAFRDDDRCS